MWVSYASECHNKVRRTNLRKLRTTCHFWYVLSHRYCEAFRPVGGDASADTKETVCVARQTAWAVMSAQTSKIGIAKTKSHCL